MPLPVVPDLYQVALHFTLSGGLEAVNVLDVQDNSGAATPAQIGEAVAVAWCESDSLVDIQSEDTTYGDIHVTPYDGASTATVLGSSTWPVAEGNAAGDPVPPQVSWVITKQTGLAGRSKRGRIYVAGVAESFMAPDVARWSSSLASTMQLAADSFLAALGGGTPILDLRVYSEVDEGTSGVINLRSNAGYFGTQRRRVRN